MGGSSSKPSPVEEREKARQREIRARGVLIPPAFGIFRPTTPSSVLNNAGLVEQLIKQDVANGILNDYMIPGLFFATKVDADTYVTGTFPLTTNNVSLVSGRIVAEKRAPKSVSRVSMGTSETDGHPSLSTSWNILSVCDVFGQIGVNGKGLIGGCLDHTFRGQQRRNDGTTSYHEDSDSITNQALRIRLGAWAPGSFKAESLRTKVSPRNAAFVDQVSGYAVVDTMGSTAAIQVDMPLDSLEISTRSYFSMNLANDASSPPLVVSLEHFESGNSNSSAMSLSQIITFDRYQLNPMEDRAPKIRNTAAWTVRMERSVHAGEEADTSLTIGGAWQVNRGLGFKTTLAKDGLTAAVLLKRWKQPRLTCSLQMRQSSDLTTRSFGLGLEIETGMLTNVGYSDTAQGYGEEDAPETKAALPLATSTKARPLRLP